MSLVEVLFLAVALSIDASVVSFCQGLIFERNKLKTSLMLALFVGGFQTIMPILGWYLARSINVYVEKYDHWLAFSIFIALGIKFITDAFKKDDEGCGCKPACLSLNCLLLLALATSIDAFAAGATLFFLHVGVLIPALIIGIITFLNSLAGFWAAYKLKKFPARYMEIFGGVILIILGFKVLIEHTVLRG